MGSSKAVLPWHLARVEGDDGAHSHDSWVFGPVPDSAVRAVVMARVWPRPRRVV